MKKWLWLALIPALVFADSSVSKEVTQDPAPSGKSSEYLCEIEVRADSITILPDNIVVSREELENPENAFQCILDSCVSNQICPAIKWNTKPGGKDLQLKLGGQAFIVGISMGCELKIQRAIRLLEEASKDLDSKTFIPPKFRHMRQDPIYVDVEPNQLTIYPEKIVVTARDLILEGNAFEKFLDEMEPKKDSQYIVLILRPGSAVFQRRLRQAIRDRGIDVGFEPWDTGRELVIPRPGTVETQEVASPKPSTVTVTSETQPYVVRPVSETLIELEVEADSFTILPDQIVVTRDELQTPGNAFELLLDQFEAKGDCPHICMTEKPGGKPLGAQLGILIKKRGEQMGCLMGLMTNQLTVLVSTPRELTGENKSPVFFECRNQQLFSISLERLKQACDKKKTELEEAADGDEAQFLRSAATTVMELDGYRLDYTYALLGKYMLTIDKDAEGYTFGETYLKETDDMWFGAQLAEIDPEEQFILFFVRPDSFKLFLQARALAWIQNINVSCELLDENDPIQIGPGGSQIYAH